jgi:hypothetical protein
MIIEHIWSLWTSGVHAEPGLERALGHRIRKQKPGAKIQLRNQISIMYPEFRKGEELLTRYDVYQSVCKEALDL